MLDLLMGLRRRITLFKKKIDPLSWTDGVPMLKFWQHLNSDGQFHNHWFVYTHFALVRIHDVSYMCNCKEKVTISNNFSSVSTHSEPSRCSPGKISLLKQNWCSLQEGDHAVVCRLNVGHVRKLQFAFWRLVCPYWNILERTKKPKKQREKKLQLADAVYDFLLFSSDFKCYLKKLRGIAWTWGISSVYYWKFCLNAC